MAEDRSLEGWMDTINKSATSFRERAKQEEDAFFNNNTPLKEFYIIREGEKVFYRVYKWDHEDFAVFYQLPNGNYSLRHKILYNKQIVRELMELN